MSVIRTFALAAFTAAALAGPALAQRDSTIPGNQRVVGRHRGPSGRGGERMGRFRDLNLTDAQKAQIKAVRARYQTQFKTARNQAKPYLEAARAGSVAAGATDLVDGGAGDRRPMAASPEVRARSWSA